MRRALRLLWGEQVHRHTVSPVHPGSLGSPGRTRQRPTRKVKNISKHEEFEGRSTALVTVGFGLAAIVVGFLALQFGTAQDFGWVFLFGGLFIAAVGLIMGAVWKNRSR